MIQVIRYKCCGKIFAANSEPSCYIDDEWLRNLKEHINRGNIVQMIETGNIRFDLCKCDNETNG
jgi:hypothetical protein